MIDVRWLRQWVSCHAANDQRDAIVNRFDQASYQLARVAHPNIYDLKCHFEKKKRMCEKQWNRSRFENKTFEPVRVVWHWYLLRFALSRRALAEYSSFDQYRCCILLDSVVAIVAMKFKIIMVYATRKTKNKPKLLVLLIQFSYQEHEWLSVLSNSLPLNFDKRKKRKK